MSRRGRRGKNWLWWRRRWWKNWLRRWYRGIGRRRRRQPGKRWGREDGGWRRRESILTQIEAKPSVCWDGGFEDKQKGIDSRARDFNRVGKPIVIPILIDIHITDLDNAGSILQNKAICLTTTKHLVSITQLLLDYLLSICEIIQSNTKQKSRGIRSIYLDSEFDQQNKIKIIII